MAKGYSTEKTATGWVLRVKYRGIRSSQTFSTKHAADVEGRKRTNLIDLGEYSKNTIVSRMSFLERLEQFIAESKPSIEYTYFKNIISLHKLSSLQFDKIDVQDVKDFITERRDQQISETTILKDVYKISRIYRYSQGQVTWVSPRVNPVSILDKDDRPKKNPHRERRLLPGEYEVILEECFKAIRQHNINNGSLRGDYLPSLFKFQIGSGLRLGETATLARSTHHDKMLENEGLVYLTKTKLNDPRWVPLTELAYEALMELKPFWGENSYFPKTSKQMSATWLSFKNNMIAREIIKQNLTLHDLRHEGLSRLFEMYDHTTGHGILNLADILLISGHKDVRTLLEKYVKIDPLDTARKLRPRAFN